MILFALVFSSSVWWILPCLLVAAAYAALLYQQEGPFSPALRKVLAGVRFLAILILCLFLINPLIKTVSSTVEKPIIIIAQDNSASLLFNKYRQEYQTTYPEALKQLQSTLGADYEVKRYTFGADLKENGSLDFSEKQTDLSALMQDLNTTYVNQNVGALIIASDGIYNKGTNPVYSLGTVKYPIYTIAMGDTTPQKDVLITGVDYNKIVYYKNAFRITIRVGAFGYKGSKVKLSVSGNKGQVFSKEINLDATRFDVDIPVDLQANELGFRRYVVQLSSLTGEVTLVNNSQTIFMEVVDGKQKIVLLAESAHPDLSAIKQSIESNENYEVKIQYVQEASMPDLLAANLVILHQLPSSQHNISTIYTNLKQHTIPVWFIIGNQTYIDLFNNLKAGLAITGSRNSVNEVQGLLSESFYSFGLSPTSTELLSHFPPLAVPFGNYSLSGTLNSLLYQKIGSVSTQLPLWSMGEGVDGKIAFLCGEGLWRWRLANYAEAKNHDAVNELLSKTVQYLTTKDDKRKFRVRTDKNQFDENEDLLFYGELYNDNYELINEPDVAMEIRNESGKKYPFAFTKTEKSYQLNAGILPVGNYTFVAKVKQGEKVSTAQGSFVVVQQQAEQVQTTADHQVLYSLSQKTGGQLFYPSSMQEIVPLLKANELIKPVSYEQKRLRDLINIAWILALLLVLLGGEWLLRKRAGGY